MPEKPPAFQFYPKDWLTSESTRMMNLDTRGIYIDMLSHCWLKGSIPIDYDDLTKLLGLVEPWFNQNSAECEKLWKCFEEMPGDPGRLINIRLDKEREKQDKRRESQSAKGVKSGESRRLAREQRLNQTRTADATSGSTQSNSSIASSTAVQEKKKKSKPKEKFDPLSIEFPPALDTTEFKELWKDWVEVRVVKKNPITAQASRMALKKLGGYGHDKALQSLSASIVGGWTGLFDPDKQTGWNGRSNSIPARSDVNDERVPESTLKLRDAAMRIVVDEIYDEWIMEPGNKDDGFEQWEIANKRGYYDLKLHGKIAKQVEEEMRAKL